MTWWAWLLVVLGIILLAVVLWWLLSSRRRRTAPRPMAVPMADVSARTSAQASPMSEGSQSPAEVSPEPDVELKAATPAAVAEIEPAAAAEPHAAPLASDDLTRVEGIGPKISAVLRAAGITTFAALADTEVARLEELLSGAGIRIANPRTWPEQARLAASGQWGELESLQGQLKGGR